MTAWTRASKACLAFALAVAGFACQPTTCKDACSDEHDDCLDEAEATDDETEVADAEAECASVYQECDSVCEGRDN